MHLIEQLFGFSPDGGTGVIELSLFLLPIAALLLCLYRRQRQLSPR
jgi:hypothetical protein